jgi:hypothetical protein
MSVRVLPEEIAELIDDALPSEDAATDEQVAKFLAEHTKSSRPNLILGRVKMLKDKYAAGESRHGSTTPVVKGGFAEARAGYHPAQLVIDTLKSDGRSTTSERRSAPFISCLSGCGQRHSATRS